MTKKHTLIVDLDDRRVVVLTDDPVKYMQEKRVRHRRVMILFITCGDYRGKIQRFGTSAFLECTHGKDLMLELSLNFSYGKTPDL